MIPSLRHRDGTLRERMDDAHCDPDLLFRTYRQFRLINSLLSGWKRLYRQRVRPFAGGRPIRILDIGCGGGDICLALAKWAISDRVDLRITGIDLDPRAIRFASSQERPETVRFLNISSGELLRSGERFDLVISNHLLHHLSRNRLPELCREAEELALRRVLFNDLRRSLAGYLLFTTLARPLFRSSYIVEDGLVSIRRSYRPDELRDLLPDRWKIESRVPFRLLLQLDKPNDSSGNEVLLRKDRNHAPES